MFLSIGPHIRSTFFFFNDTATTEIYTLSLHDALPIFAATADREGRGQAGPGSQSTVAAVPADEAATQKDLSVWQLAFGCGAWDGGGRATSGSSSPTNDPLATGASWRPSVTITPAPIRP